MICDHCGAENPYHATFCPNCGNQLKNVSQRVAWSQHLPQEPMLPSRPGQVLFSEQPPRRQQGNGSGTASSLGGGQLWEAFGSGASVSQLPIPDRVTGPLPELHQMADSVGGLPTKSVPPTARTRWYRVLEPRLGVLGKPLPFWVNIAGIGLIVVGLVALGVTGSDWAEGAMHVAFAAGIVTTLIIVATGIRVLAGLRGAKRFVLAGFGVFLLLVLGITGVTQQALIHREQGHFLEGQRQWTRAIMEYQLGGEQASTADDIARTYVEWGEFFSTGQDYQDAIAKFEMVQADYGSAMNEVKRAQSDEIAAYLAWSDQEIKAENYTTAIGNLDTLLNLPYCDSSCQAQANALDATTYYKNAESELSAQQYDNAVNDFKMVLTRFPNSPQAQQLHPDLAQALLGQGQQQLATDCSSAIPTYQELSTMFGDTPAGQQGTKALKASQPVTGHFTSSIPNDPSLTVVAALLKNLNNGISSDQFFQLLNGAPTATIRSDGTFVFKPLPQGTYDLAWGTERSNGNKSFNTNYYTGSGAPFYVATVGPLCAFDFGDINETIPVTQ